MPARSHDPQSVFVEDVNTWEATSPDFAGGSYTEVPRLPRGVSLAARIVAVPLSFAMGVALVLQPQPLPVLVALPAVFPFMVAFMLAAASSHGNHVVTLDRQGVTFTAFTSPNGVRVRQAHVPWSEVADIRRGGPVLSKIRNLTMLAIGDQRVTFVRHGGGVLTVPTDDTARLQAAARAMMEGRDCPVEPPVARIWGRHLWIAFLSSAAILGSGALVAWLLK